ncbi:putative importin 13 protein [Botrytis cinerea BcDW1]|uniref:Putative importin 13 protein n=1 Tax=Botryotinia fuckeliana (strain BcDW1) TaxID=1290391 RepID=M7UUM0_BOTF1|nr:putative importin 13 protein [Botrytis cinerea BcDW1]
METEKLPSSLDEVEALVHQLYKAGPPQRVSKIQETLQKLQRSPAGWELANGLLGSNSENVKFFGALTFTIKLNTDSQSLKDDDAQIVLQQIIGWLIKCLNSGCGPLVVRKLCTTLVTYFLHFSSSWARCISHLTYCLCLGEAVPYHKIEDAPAMAALAQNLPDDKSLAILWFSATLVEEVGKTDSNSMKQHKFHEYVVQNVEDIVTILTKGIVNTTGVPINTKVRQESMKCFQSWVLYSHRAFLDAAIVLDPLRTLTQPALMLIINDDLYEITVELFADILANYSSFLSENDFTMLYDLFSSSWAQERYSKLIQGDFDFDSVQFGQFLLSFGDATVQDLAQNISTDSRSQQILSALVGLLGADGYIVNEDKIFVPAVEFWAVYLETVLDLSNNVDASPPWLPAARSVLMQAIEKCWLKMQFPPKHEFSSWDSNERAAFKDARRDVGDLIQQSYMLLGLPLVSSFVDLILKSVEKGDAWGELEASLTCLAEFQDYIKEESDEYLDKVFGSPLFSMLTRSDSTVPSRTRQAFLMVINGYPDYFERHTQHLPSALNLMFSMLHSPTLARVTSKSIAMLCSSCRKVLVPELAAFLQQYSEINRENSVESYAKEGVIGAIASIIEAMPNDELKLDPLRQLLDFVQRDHERSLHLLSTQFTNVASNVPVPDSQVAADEVELTAIRCLISIGKGLQVPADTPVDLNTSENSYSYWKNGNGRGIQVQVLNILTAANEAFPGHGEVTEEISHVFRTGLVETDGPFAFPPEDVAKFIFRSNYQTPRVITVINTACSLINSCSTTSDERNNQILSASLTWVSGLMEAINHEPSNDPEISQPSIEFLHRLISTPKNLHILLNHEPKSSLEHIFMFTLKALTGRDPLPKQSAAEFWASFVSLPTNNPDAHVQQAITNALQHLGPLLAQALIYNIGGAAARSELDKLSDPLRKLVVSQVRAKSWLEAALIDGNFPSDKVDQKEKMVFLTKVMNLRGARGTNAVVREFWLACRGSNFAYVS